MKQENCRLCKGLLSEPVLKLPQTPLANEFLKTKDPQDLFPLEICCCTQCEHYQLNETVDPERLFRNYVFVAGTSKVNVEHFANYANDIVEKFSLLKKSKVLDIASNDGTLLKEFKKLGMTVLGIDPALDIAKEAESKGIPTIPEFFTEEYAAQMLEEYGTFDLITANNVFAHVPDLEDFAKGVRKILAPNGVFSFEVSYFLDVCERTLFDTIYHEHTSYHTIRPLQDFFRTLGMELVDVKNIDTHGGSIRVFVKHFNGQYNARTEMQKKSSLYSILSKEDDMKRMVKGLKTDIKVLGLELREKLRNIKAENKSIAIYGTPAKATTLMYAFDLDPNMIDFAVDDNPLKQDTFTPGKHIPVLPSSAIKDKSPDVILVLAWNFAESIIEKCKANGYEGKFIVPLPELRIV